MLVNMNLGSWHCLGKYLKFHDAGDIPEPNRFSIEHMI